MDTDDSSFRGSGHSNVLIGVQTVICGGDVGSRTPVLTGALVGFRQSNAQTVPVSVGSIEGVGISASCFAAVGGTTLTVLRSSKHPTPVSAR
jgi:hypothetical protein